MDCDQLYDRCIDDFLTGDIDNLPDHFLFSCIEKFGIETLDDQEAEEARQRRADSKPDEPCPF